VHGEAVDARDGRRRAGRRRRRHGCSAWDMQAGQKVYLRVG
jgi:hypothetical protein